MKSRQLCLLDSGWEAGEVSKLGITFLFVGATGLSTCHVGEVTGDIKVTVHSGTHSCSLQCGSAEDTHRQACLDVADSKHLPVCPDVGHRCGGAR